LRGISTSNKNSPLRSVFQGEGTSTRLPIKDHTPAPKKDMCKHCEIHILPSAETFAQDEAQGFRSPGSEPPQDCLPGKRRGLERRGRDPNAPLREHGASSWRCRVSVSLKRLSPRHLKPQKRLRIIEHGGAPTEVGPVDTKGGGLDITT